MKRKKTISNIIYHVLVCAFGLVMIYPLVWMVMSSFKDTNTIFTTATSLIPEKFTLQNYVNGWKGFAKVGFGTFFKNSLFISNYRHHWNCTVFLCGSLWICQMQIPRQKASLRSNAGIYDAARTGADDPSVSLVSEAELGWNQSALIVPYCFAIQGFFVYMMTNFIEGIPRELDEAAKIDGCSYYTIFTKIIFPLMVPTMITGCIFSFMWRWDDFLGALLYVNKTEKYPVSLALKMFCDPSSSSDYGAMFAMATLSILPAVLIFFCLQRYLVEGISTSA